jgi:CysZ protein
MPISQIAPSARSMILEAASAALSRLFSPAYRSVLFKSLGLTLLVLLAAWFGLQWLFDAFALPWIERPTLPDWAGWLGWATAILWGIGAALALALLVAPAAALVAGFFLDDIAALVERDDYPDDPPGRALPVLTAFTLSLKFLGVVVAGNLFALLLLLVPGVNAAAFLVVNGYLLGREYFEFAAMRFRSEAEAKALRRRHAGAVFLAGLLIALFLAVPVVNLAAPLFAATMMVHLNKMVSARDRGR